jgi:Na+/proline symporter
VLISSSIIPLIFTILWSKQTTLAAVISPALGLISGFAVWLGSIYGIYGEISIATTQLQAPSLYGSMASLFTLPFYSVIITYIKPDQKAFDWREFLRISVVADGEKSSGTSSPNVEAAVLGPGSDEKTAVQDNTTVSAAPTSQQPLDDIIHPYDKATLKELRRWLKFAMIFLVAIVLLTWLIWLIPLYRDVSRISPLENPAFS